LCTLLLSMIFESILEPKDQIKFAKQFSF